MRSLTVKLILAFLLISVIGIGLAAVLARAVTGREFDRFIMDSARGEFLADAVSYYQTHGSWDGAGTTSANRTDTPSRERRPDRVRLCWWTRRARLSPRWGLIAPARISRRIWLAEKPSK